MVPDEIPTETWSSCEAVLRVRTEGGFDVVCPKCSAVLAAAVSMKAAYWSVGAVVSHCCPEPKG